jgi:hypothetical protein
VEVEAGGYTDVVITLSTPIQVKKGYYFGFTWQGPPAVTLVTYKVMD